MSDPPIGRLAFGPAGLYTLAMTLAYFDCFGGASGDMILGALLDAGLRLDDLRDALKRLGVTGYRLSAERVTRGGLGGTKFHVHLGEDEPEPPHDHAHDHDRPHTHDHGHDHAHEHPPAHGHSHDHPHDADLGHSHPHRPATPPEPGHDHPHPHEHGHAHGRNLTDILHLLDHAGLSERADQWARRIFQRLAAAEAKVHNTTPDQVHFHEVGAVDSIVDIIGAAIALDRLGVDRVVCSPIPLGTGTVRCDHGLMPVPAPATAELMRDGVIAPSDFPRELCTPTGAAILTTLAESFGPLPAMRVDAIGYGAGGRDDPGRANLLRVFLGRDAAAGQADTVMELTANIDDLSGQLLGAVLEQLLEAGALDAWASPLVMKKSRPAWQLGVLCSPQAADALEGLIFRETTTIGIRRRPASRSKLARRHVRVETPYGPVRVKVSSAGDGEEYSATPEFDDCLQAARTHHVPVKEVQQAALERYRQGQGQPL